MSCAEVLISNDDDVDDGDDGDDDDDDDDDGVQLYNIRLYSVGPSPLMISLEVETVNCWGESDANWAILDSL